MVKKILFINLCILFLSLSVAMAGVKDEPFIQEYHEAYPIRGNAHDNNVRAIIVDRDDNVWACAKGGVFMLKNGQKEWKTALGKKAQGPAYAALADSKGRVWLGIWNGLYVVDRGENRTLRKIENVKGPITAITEMKERIVAFGPYGQWRIKDGRAESFDLPISRSIRRVIQGKNSDYYVAGGRGIYHVTGNKIKLYQDEKALLSSDIYGLDFTKDGRLWIGGLGGITVYEGNKRIASITPEDGLPSVWISVVRCAPDGVMWVGTNMGAARYDGKTWSLRHSRRWLLNDEVHDIAFDGKGTAWIATAGGVSAIKKRSMTLAEKAAYYYDICMKRHVRPPYIVEKCRLKIPGDLSSYEPMDDDNDGQYTGMYLAMESYRYAVTKSADAKEKARKAFEFLKYLEEVTPIDGFVARTVIPVNWERMADPNRSVSDREWAEKFAANSRAKRYARHWYLSEDGKWRWKGDTSSDEITGHMYGYLFYYNLVAEGKEKARVRDHILKVVDYIMKGDYTLIGMDGTHTSWGVWAPHYLNDNPDWAPEQGINTIEILSYLKLAYHVSGKQKYQHAYYELLDKYHYRDHIVGAKSLMPAWRTHIDDELLLLAYAALVMHEDDPQLKQLYRKSLDNWYNALKNDDSPFFYFFYNAFAGNRFKYERSMFVLRDNPLDLIRWRVDNSRREDISLTHSPILEDRETSRLLPLSERGVMRWDKNPWAAVQGDGGHTESSGVFWLLAYWEGRYYGLID